MGVSVVTRGGPLAHADVSRLGAALTEGLAAICNSALWREYLPNIPYAPVCD